MSVNRERMELWIQALEQDRFTKCKGQLRIVSLNQNGKIVFRHCALGVGVQVALENGIFDQHAQDEQFNDIVFNASGGFLPDAVIQWYGLHCRNPRVNFDDEKITIQALNDDHNPEEHSFWDIAQLMRATYLKDDMS